MTSAEENTNAWHQLESLASENKKGEIYLSCALYPGKQGKPSQRNAQRRSGGDILRSSLQSYKTRERRKQPRLRMRSEKERRTSRKEYRTAACSPGAPPFLFVAGLLHLLRHMPALVSFRGWPGPEKKKTARRRVLTTFSDSRHVPMQKCTETPALPEVETSTSMPGGGPVPTPQLSPHVTWP